MKFKPILSSRFKWKGTRFASVEPEKKTANTEEELTIYKRFHNTWRSSSDGKEYPSPSVYFLLSLPAFIFCTVWLLSDKIDMSKGSPNVIDKHSDPTFFWLYWGIFLGVGILFLLAGLVLGLTNKNSETEEIIEQYDTAPTPKKKIAMNFMAGIFELGIYAFIWLLGSVIALIIKELLT